MNKFYLPEIETITVSDYSLYQCPLKIDFSKKLNIIYGTNGTGKSTLMMLILFSIVGLYRGSIRTQMRLEKRRDSRPLFREDYFSARSREGDHNPEVTIDFSINNDHYVVKHSLFNGKLMNVIINNELLHGKLETYKKYEDLYSRVRSGRNEEIELEKYLVFQYHERLKLSTKLPGGVNTLINMLMNVMFFNEDRRLTFWNKDLQETVIGKYIVDADFYDSFIEKKLTTKALESAYKKKSETYNYMSKFFAKENEENAKEANENDLDAREQIDELEKRIEELSRKLNDDKLFYREKSDELIKTAHEEELVKEAQRVLEEAWYNNLLPDHYKNYYTRFSRSISDDICPLCGNQHVFSVSMDTCVMCGNRLTIREPVDIAEIDVQRQNNYDELVRIKKRLDTLNKEIDEIRSRIETIRKEIDNLNVRRNELSVSLNPDADHVANSDRKRLEKAKADRNEALQQLNSSKEEENNMRETIEQSLVDNFESFRTVFLRYADKFFGSSHSKNLSLPFQQYELASTPLMRFELDNKIREEEYMLSESQRIFTDLAYRFAVLTTFHEHSFFICETPDSTLDIFHEDNAAQTFLEYINKGNALILSANARYSKLVAKLYQDFNPSEVMVVDLTKISTLALPMDYHFERFLTE